MPAASGSRVSARDRPTRAARPGTGSASISRCSPPTPPRSSCACSTMPAAPSSSASSCPNTPTRSGTAICPTRGPARSTAIACTARTSPRNGHRFNPNKLVLDPYAKAFVGALRWDNALFGYTHRVEGRGPQLRPARQRALHAEMPRHRSGLHLGPRAPARGALGSHHHLRNACPRLHQAASRRAGEPARHLLRPRPQGGGRLHPLPRRHLGRTAADPRLRRTIGICWRRASPTTGATTPSASSRRIRAIPRCPPSCSPNSRRWWRACTMPASR